MKKLSGKTLWNVQFVLQKPKDHPPERYFSGGASASVISETLEGAVSAIKDQHPGCKFTSVVKASSNLVFVEGEE